MTEPVTKEERLQWKADSAAVDKFVDQMVASVKNNQGQEAVVYMAVDMIFRSYLQWIHAAQITRADPQLTRDSAINVMNILIMELAGRIRGMDEKGERIDLTTWVGELAQDLAATLAEDCKLVEKPKQIILPN